MTTLVTLMIWILVAALLVNTSVFSYYKNGDNPRSLTKPNVPNVLNDNTLRYGLRKRPFCNAFTGCGRKRSNLPVLTDKGEVLDDSIASLMEMNGEPALEDLSRQIMSEAKLWEAIQEANIEMRRRHQDTNNQPSSEDVAVPAKSAVVSCALPPCYI